MSLLYVLRNILNLQKKIDVTKLPSQGLFYKDDFEVSIKKADIEDIIDYEYNYDGENLGLIISKLKNIVEKNVTVGEPYKYDDIKAIDIIFIFLEIVKFTNGKPVTISYFNNMTGKEEPIAFESENFNYFNLDQTLLQHYDDVNKEFNFGGYRYSIPSIGVENSLTKFLIHKAESKDTDSYENYSYDFLYFLGNKTHLTFDEIDNLLQIFNSDIDTDEKKKIAKIVKELSIVGKYSLLRDSQVIDVNSKLDLSKIWK